MNTQLQEYVKKLQGVYKNHKQWPLPLTVGFLVFVVAQGALVFSGFIYDNPLPELSGSDIEFAVPAGSSGLDARIVIPKAGIDVPIVWSKSREEEALQVDLQHGALRYPGTPEPGEFGNSFITAHSSDFPWKPGEYKQAFASLGELELGDADIYVVYSHNGEEVRREQFRVTEKDIVKPTDTRMIEQRDKTEMTLVTCWPIGTAWRRLMIKTELVEAQEI